jgi:hypothetical protein
LRGFIDNPVPQKIRRILGGRDWSKQQLSVKFEPGVAWNGRQPKILIPIEAPIG